MAIDCESNVTRLNLHSEGGLSSIYRAVGNADTSFYALKIVRGEEGDVETNALWSKEVACLSRLDHPNIVRMIGSSSHLTDGKVEYKILLEWLDQTVANWLQSPDFVFTTSKWLSISKDFIAGIAHAHSCNIAHRDLKPENLMFRNDGGTRKLVIADFGIGRVGSEINDAVTLAHFRTPAFAPSDHDTRDPYARDVYSAAAVILQFTTGEIFRDAADIRRRLEELKGRLHPDHLDLLERSLDINPDVRPKNMVDFKSQFESIYKQNVQPMAQSDKKVVYLALTNKARDVLSSGPSIKDDAANSLLHRILRDSDVSATIERDRDLSSGEFTLHLYTNEWTMTCKTKDLDSETPYLLVVGAKQPFFDELDRWRSNAEEISNRFRFNIREEMYSAQPSLGASTLVEFLKSKNPDFAGKQGLTDALDTWGRVLEAKEEHALSKFEPMEYDSYREDAGYVVFKVGKIPEGDLSQTFWRIAGYDGCTFEVSHSDVDGIWTKPSRRISGLPKMASLELSLGADRSSFLRQRDALAAVARMTDENFDNLAATISKPSETSALPPRSQVTPIIRNIDQDKLQAVSGALATNDVYLVEGPPGTGKTNFIAELVLQIIQRDPFAKILLTAQTHVALDNAISRLHALGFDDMLRIGDAGDQRLKPAIRTFLVGNKIREWKDNIRKNSNLALQNLIQESGFTEQELTVLKLLRELLESTKILQRQHEVRSSTSKTISGTLIDDSKHEIESEVELVSNASIGIESELIALGESTFSPIASERIRQLHERIAEFENKSPVSKQILEILDVQSSWLLKLPTDKDLHSRLVRRTTLLAGTCVGVLREPAIRDMEFDYCIIDEASKATATEALVPIAKSKRALLVGDSNQLPPNEEDLLQQTEILAHHSLTVADVKTTLFEHLRTQLPASKIAKLSTQYRMSKPIGDLISECFYEGHLVSDSTHQIQGFSENIGKQVRWLDTSRSVDRREVQHHNGSYLNRLEAKLIASEISDFVEKVRSGKVQLGTGEPSILVVAMYLAQKQAITDALRKRDINYPHISVETADAVQGTEADIVFVSITRSNARNKIGFLDRPNWRRINVALSRAKYGLNIVGDAEFVEHTDGGLALALKYVKEHPSDCELIQS